jgi:hypothetical protein
MSERKGTRRQHQTTISGARERRDRVLHFPSIAHVDRSYLHAERWRGGLDGAEHADTGADRRIADDRGARHAQCDLLEQL